jgi:hypothetical protein
MRISDGGTTVHVQDYKNLRAAWKTYHRHSAQRFIVKEALTAKQLKRLPKGLKKRLESADDSIAFLGACRA